MASINSRVIDYDEPSGKNIPAVLWMIRALSVQCRRLQKNKFRVLLLNGRFISVAYLPVRERVESRDQGIKL